jgi:lysophospholipid acyltransferase (LPLAT)-like uncharacterized protein
MSGSAPQEPALERIATAWGRVVARYARAVVTAARTRPFFDEPLLDRACIWIAWHEANVVSMVLHGLYVKRPIMGFVSGGLTGAAMYGWMQSLGISPIRYRAHEKAGWALEKMRQALADGSDVMLAVDGPDGPRRQVKPGALWLASRSNADLRAVGVAARPALRFPRWDRILVPLPGASVAATFGAPLRLDVIPRTLRAAKVADALNDLTARAETKLRQGPAKAGPPQ